ALAGVLRKIDEFTNLADSDRFLLWLQQQPVGMRADFKEVAVLTFATCTLRCRCAAEQPARQFLHEMQFADAGGPGNQPGMAQTILLLQLAQVLKRRLAPGQKRHQPASPGNGRPVRSATPRS